MAIRVCLVDWTEQGLRNLKDSPKRRQAFFDLCQKHGVRVREFLYTVGPHNILAVVEGSDEGIGTVMLSVQSKGSVRVMAMRALTAETFDEVLKNVE